MAAPCPPGGGRGESWGALLVPGGGSKWGRGAAGREGGHLAGSGLPLADLRPHSEREGAQVHEQVRVKGWGDLCGASPPHPRGPRSPSSQLPSLAKPPPSSDLPWGQLPAPHHTGGATPQPCSYLDYAGLWGVAPSPAPLHGSSEAPCAWPPKGKGGAFQAGPSWGEASFSGGGCWSLSTRQEPGGGLSARCHRHPHPPARRPTRTEETPELPLAAEAAQKLSDPGLSHH